MKAQLVLQFRTTEDLDSFDRTVRFEEELMTIIGKTAKADGHDFGLGGMNIFILTDDPVATFSLTQKTGDSVRPTGKMKAAYRLLDREDYVCLWPPELSHFEVG